MESLVDENEQDAQSKGYKWERTHRAKEDCKPVQGRLSLWRDVLTSSSTRFRQSQALLTIE